MISPETGLPVGAQATPTGVYDFSQVYKNVQDLFSTIGEGQAKMAERQQKDKVAWDNAMLDFPEGDYIQGDEDWIQEAVDAYNEKAMDFQGEGLDLKNLDRDKRKELNDLKKEAKQRAAKAKENMAHLKAVQAKIEIDGGVNYDIDYGGEWITEYINMSPQERIERRQLVTAENTPYIKNFSPVDVVNRATKAQGMNVEKVGNNMEGYYDIDALVNRIEADSFTGIGKRAYIRNRQDGETEREFAIRMGKLAENILKMEERPIRASGGRTTSAGVYMQPGKMDISGLDSTGSNRSFTDPNRMVNSIKVKGARAGLAPQITFGDIQSTGSQVKLTPTSITVDADGNYWVHGAATDATGNLMLDRAYLLNDEIIQTINFQYDMDIIADLQAAEQAAFDQFKVKD